MSNQHTLASLSARVQALRHAMEGVKNGSVPDFGKWGNTPRFAGIYSDLANTYISITGDRTVNLYDLNRLQSWANTTWPQQKALFDQIFTDVLILESLIQLVEIPQPGPVYNLLVSGSDASWLGEPFKIDLGRCVREYTSPALTKRYGNLDNTSASELMKAPCIFAYETGWRLPPKFGYIRNITNRQGEVRIEYEILGLEHFLSHEDLDALKFELDISKSELYRTHWAVKEVDLAKELHAKGIRLPSSVRDVANAVDVSTHVFDVALSFPGEVRSLVEDIAQELERRLGPNTYFYDNNYTSQLARPSLDTLLQGIYSRAKLDVVFLSTDYQKKNWCGIEFRAIREIMHKREDNRIMFVRTDDGNVDGVFKTDGYVDSRQHGADKIADFICQRLNLLNLGEKKE